MQTALEIFSQHKKHKYHYLVPTNIPGFYCVRKKNSTQKPPTTTPPFHSENATNANKFYFLFWCFCFVCTESHTHTHKVKSQTPYTRTTKYFFLQQP